MVLPISPFSWPHCLPVLPSSIPTSLLPPFLWSFFLAPPPTCSTFFHSYLLLCSYLRGPTCLPFFSAPPPSCPIFFCSYLLLCSYLLCGPTQFPFFSAPSPTCPIFFCSYLQQSSCPTSFCSSSYWLFAAFALPGPSAWNIPVPFFTLPPPRHPLNRSFKETSQSCLPPRSTGTTHAPAQNCGLSLCNIITICTFMTFL